MFPLFVWILQVVYGFCLDLFFFLGNRENNLNSIHCEIKIRNKFHECGITIGGSGPTHIQVHNPKFFTKVAFHPAMGIVESYIEGWWTANDLPAFFNKLVTHWGQLSRCNYYGCNSKWKMAWLYLYDKNFNLLSSFKDPPCICGSKLCVTILDWIAHCNDIIERNNKRPQNNAEEVESSSCNKSSKMIRKQWQLFRSNDCGASAKATSILQDFRSMGFKNSNAVEDWIKNFERPQLAKRYGDSFSRMWQFYLHSVAAAFRFKNIDI